MNTPEHAFPLPEAESHKLDDILPELPRNRVARLARNLDQKNIVIAASALAVLGCVLGFFLLRRRR